MTQQIIRWDDMSVGDALPAHQAGPVTRTVLALFAGGSGDHNPIHIDLDFARKYGADDVFAQGMLSMAYLSQLLTRWVPQEYIRSFGVRFSAITPVHANIFCTAKVTEKFNDGDEKRVRISLSARIDDGTDTLLGEAVVTLP